MISVFTPTHSPKFLGRTAASLVAQTFDNFEWVIVPNGNVNVDDIISAIGDYDEKLVIHIHPFYDSTNIGAIKNFACSKCRGEILVELDHDDELTPDALQEVAAAFDDQSVDFVYSNFCDINADGTSRTFGAEYGWQSRPLPNGRIETVAFPPSPASILRIHFCANHLRAWRREFYERLGGHDKTLDVLDDHDLVCRTYIHGKMLHIDKPLYNYFIHGGNTCYGELNAKIQEKTLEIHDKYVYAVCERWADLNGLRKIDLGGRFDCPPGYESVDLKDANIICDLNESPWPFRDGEVGLIRCHDLAEHLKSPISMMKEVWRILAPSGWFLSLTPSSSGRGGDQDPTHISYFNSNSWWYYCRAQQARYIDTPVRFQLNRCKNFYPSDWHKFHEILYVKADLVKLDDSNDKLGPNRVPGIIEI